LHREFLLGNLREWDSLENVEIDGEDIKIYLHSIEWGVD
jgi:hypothetical protein